MEQYLVLDIGGTFVKYAVMTGDVQFVVQGKVPVDHSSEEAMYAALEAVRDAVAGYEYEGVAISMPGRIDTKHGIAYTGGAFSWLHDYPAAERYGAVFGKPATIANDGKCAAYAESWKGALADAESGAAIVLGTGVGGGIILNGKVWMGHTGGAGEFSGLLVDFNAMGLPFPQSMSALWANRISAATITKNYAARKGLESADGVMLFDAYEAGDEDAKAVIEECAYQAATGLMSLQATLDLQRYAIGGGISARPETTEVIRKAFDDLYDPLAAFLPYGKPEIVTCTFGNEANLIGALAFHLEQQK